VYQLIVLAGDLLPRTACPPLLAEGGRICSTLPPRKQLAHLPGFDSLFSSTTERSSGLLNKFNRKVDGLTIIDDVSYLCALKMVGTRLSCT
jgi:hypothetical protein